jgi:hypothetical protein
LTEDGSFADVYWFKQSGISGKVISTYPYLEQSISGGFGQSETIVQFDGEEVVEIVSELGKSVFYWGDFEIDYKLGGTEEDGFGVYDYSGSFDFNTDDENNGKTS